MKKSLQEQSTEASQISSEEALDRAMIEADRAMEKVNQLAAEAKRRGIPLHDLIPVP